MKEQVNQSVYKYFKEISSVPRQSGNEEGIKNYLINFAKIHNLKYFADKYNNVIIYKNNIQPIKKEEAKTISDFDVTNDQNALNKESIILHSHTDMVCVKNAKSSFDFDKDDIEIIQKNGYLRANNTTLGADNGIGIAMILSILDSDLPVNIEALFTATEETTMQGAYKVDTSRLHSKNLVCLDGFEQNAILTSTSNFTDFLVTFNKQKKLLTKAKKLNFYEVCVSGLLGGHSGSDIDKFRLNAHKLLARILQNIKDYYLIDFYGGKNFNVIPNASHAIFATELSEKSVQKVLKNVQKQVIFGLKSAKKRIKIKQKKLVSEKESKQYFYVLNRKEKSNLKKEINHQMKTLSTSVLKIEPQKDYLVYGKNFVNFINLFNQGVLTKNKFLQVDTSQNLSEVSASKGFINIGIRSATKNGEKPFVKRLLELSQQNNMTGKVLGAQPGFSTKPKSKLKEVLKKTNANSFETSLHIAVELGVLQERIKNLDAVIISPTILDAHSTKERVEIKSINSTYNWLIEFLKTY